VPWLLIEEMEMTEPFVNGFLCSLDKLGRTFEFQSPSTSILQIHLQHITHTSYFKYTLFVTNNYFLFFGNGCYNRLPISNPKDRVEGILYI
jgi:hypothetical protein